MVLAEDLRQAVLQAALQGKLTKQLDTDSSVDEMLDNIQKEKEKLIAEKKIKKEKQLSEIQDEEIPFEIPDNWRWVRLQSFLDVRDGTHDSPKYVENGIPFVTSKNLNNGKIDFSDIKYITKEDADIFNARSKVDKNDILMAMIGSIGKPVLVDIEEEFAIKNMALFKSVPKSNINMNYVLFLLEYAESIMKTQSTGGVQKFVSLTYLREFMSPLPPIEEQQRIVDKINEIMPKIDEYEKIEKELETLKREFPTDMKDALLQAAMQGKLTEQLDSDSSVDELLTSIKTEKEKLITQKKIKKEEPLPEIEKEEIPFDIPENWRWVRLGNIIKLTSGQDLQPDKYSENNIGIPYLTGASNFQEGNLLINRYTSSETSIAYNGDLLVTCKGTIGEMAFMNIEKAHIARQIMGISKLGHINLKYIKLCLENFILKLKANARSIIPGIDRKVILNLPIPLPPIEEQQRIVERLDTLLPLCEDLS
ncbi:MAG: restriction endonuclease subunit S [Blautia sp.]|nr:restriction endonuclease subunit S [Lachnoclostridium sp.]MCM1211387.1 restriction endonuclease subunit S [Blautia sp.]